MTRFIQIETCEECPYCQGLDSDLLVGWEELSCSYVRMTTRIMGDEFEPTKIIGNYYRTDGIYENLDAVPPEWCPLPNEVYDRVTPRSNIRIVRV
jgi:hypothetical protein